MEEAEMDIPEAMVRTEARRSVEEYSRQLRMQGLSIEQYYQFTGLDEDKMIEQSMPDVEKNIKGRVALEAVARAEGLTAEDADVDKELEEMAQRYRTEADKLKEMMGPQEMKMLRKDIIIRKALDFVVENAVEK